MDENFAISLSLLFGNVDKKKNPVNNKYLLRVNVLHDLLTIGYSPD